MQKGTILCKIQIFVMTGNILDVSSANNCKLFYLIFWEKILKIFFHLQYATFLTGYKAQVFSLDIGRHTKEIYYAKFK